MSNELIERLRDIADMTNWEAMIHEAADLIEQLQRELRIKDCTIGQMSQDAQNLKAYYEQVYQDGSNRIAEQQARIAQLEEALAISKQLAYDLEAISGIELKPEYKEAINKINEVLK